MAWECAVCGKLFSISLEAERMNSVTPTNAIRGRQVEFRPRGRDDTTLPNKGSEWRQLTAEGISMHMALHMAVGEWVEAAKDRLGLGEAILRRRVLSMGVGTRYKGCPPVTASKSAFLCR